VNGDGGDPLAEDEKGKTDGAHNTDGAGGRVLDSVLDSVMYLGFGIQKYNCIYV